MAGQGDILKQIPLQIKYSWFPRSKHQQVLARWQKWVLCWLICFLGPIQASPGNLLSPGELWLCLPSTYLLSPRCVVSLSTTTPSTSEGLPQSSPLTRLTLPVASLLAWLLGFKPHERETEELCNETFSPRRIYSTYLNTHPILLFLFHQLQTNNSTQEPESNVTSLRTMTRLQLQPPNFSIII